MESITEQNKPAEKRELFVAANTTEESLANSIVNAVSHDGGCLLSLAGKWGAYRALKGIAIARQRLDRKHIQMCMDVGWQMATGRRDGDEIAVIKINLTQIPIKKEVAL